MTHLEKTHGLMLHIGLALFSYATLTITALHALQVALIDYLLKIFSMVSEISPLLSIYRKIFHVMQIVAFC
ncbi:MAG: cytochrome c biogenesis protein CcsA [Candidatus Malihini olakiniferum]